MIPMGFLLPACLLAYFEALIEKACNEWPEVEEVESA